MAIPNNISKEDIFKAIQYIDENGVPNQNKSKKYELVDESGKTYPVKYVIAVANHLVNHVDISTEEFHAEEAKKFLEKLDFIVETKQEKFKLTISANKEETVQTENKNVDIERLQETSGYRNPYSHYLIESKNIILGKYK